MNEHYFVGFVKAAMANGLSEGQALDLYKEAKDNPKESWFSKYLNMKIQSDLVRQDSPWKSLLATPGFLADGAVMRGIGLYPGFGEMMSNRILMGKGEKTKEETLKNSTDAVKNRSYGGSALHGIAKSGPAALLGAGIGGVIGNTVDNPFLSSSYRNPFNTTDAMLDTLGGAATGAGVGVLSQVIRALINKAVINNTNPVNQAHARDMKAKHPNTTSLPFGDMIGAAH